MISTAVGALTASLAHAQGAPQAQVEEVVVTASRVERAGFTAPTPTTVLGQAELQQRGTTNISEILNELPSFRPTNTQTQRTVFQGAGQNNADLRGLGNRRTLVLVDGRRHVGAPVILATGVAIAVDLNLIPTIMLSRSEVVTGGASASWGSDAVAGVVNFITDRTLNGFRSDASYGQTKYGDQKEYRAGAVFGHDFAGDKGHLTIGGEYVKQGEVKNAFASRPWGPKLVALIAATPAERAAGFPAQIYSSPVENCQRPPGGVILATINAAGTAVTQINSATATSNPFRGVAFGPNGARIPWDYGSQRGTTSIGGCQTNYNLDLVDRQGLLWVPVERYSTMINVDYNITPNLKAFVQMGLADSVTRYPAPPRRDFNTTLNAPQDFIRIERDNAYLPADLRAAMVANNVSGFFLGRSAEDIGAPRATVDNLTRRIAAGLEGQLGGSWKWDAYVQYGKNRTDLRYRHLSLEYNFRNALDAVVNSSGQIVCRINQSRVVDAACAPINVLGNNGISAAADAYTHGTYTQLTDVSQTVAAVNLHGDLFSTWAGPVGVAAGAEYRDESLDVSVDATAQQGLFDYNNNRPYGGANSVKEAYAEAVVPLAKDSPFAKSLDLQLAGRITDYRRSGTVKTWKVGVSWEPVEQVRLRLTRSRDIRAPQLSELFTYSNSTVAVTNPFTNINTGPITGIVTGNPDLKPEIADTLTAGVVLQPTVFGLDGLRLSVDYYDINVKEAIASYTPQQIADGCFRESGAAGGFFCRLLTTSGTPGPSFVISGVVNTPFNLNRQTARGIDFEAAYALPLAGGRLSLRAIATRNIEQINYDTAGAIENAGFLTSTPKWSGLLSTTYARDSWSTTLQARYIGKVGIDPVRLGPTDAGYNPALANSVSDNQNAGVVYWNLSGQYNLVERANGGRVQIYGVVNNLLDRKPPATGASFFYDQLGRTYKNGVRFNF